MKIRQKVILIVTASILATALPGIAVIYGYAQHSIVATESLELELTTAEIAKSVEQHFAKSKLKLSSLAHILEKELVKPIQSSEIKDFNFVMEKNLDGVWRNRKSSYDGKYEAGIFLPENAHDSDAQKGLPSIPNASYINPLNTSGPGTVHIDPFRVLEKEPSFSDLNG